MRKTLCLDVFADVKILELTSGCLLPSSCSLYSTRCAYQKCWEQAVHQRVTGLPVGWHITELSALPSTNRKSLYVVTPAFLDVMGDFRMFIDAILHCCLEFLELLTMDDTSTNRMSCNGGARGSEV